MRVDPFDLESIQRSNLPNEVERIGQGDTETPQARVDLDVDPGRPRRGLRDRSGAGQIVDRWSEAALEQQRHALGKRSREQQYRQLDAGFANRTRVLEATGRQCLHVAAGQTAGNGTDPVPVCVALESRDDACLWAEMRSQGARVVCQRP